MIITLRISGALLGSQRGVRPDTGLHRSKRRTPPAPATRSSAALRRFSPEGAPEKQAISQACLYASLSTTKSRDAEVVSFNRTEFEAQKQNKRDNLELVRPEKTTGG